MLTLHRPLASRGSARGHRRSAAEKRFLGLLAFVVLQPACGTSVASPPAEQNTTTSAVFGSSRESNAVVKRIVDGDTLVAQIGERSETVRLIGIDTPESVARTRPVQCFGKEASQRLEALLPASTPVTLILDIETRDMYDRLLGYVVRSGDDLFVNLDLVALGYAVTLNYAPNDRFADVFARAEAQAKSLQLGLWGACGGPGVPLE